MDARPQISPDDADARLRAVAEIAAAPSNPISRALDAMRQLLAMDMAYVADTRGDQCQVLALSGDAESFGARIGLRVPLAGTYCGELLLGRLDGLVTDARHDPRVQHLPGTEQGGVGAYIGQPIKLWNGNDFGTLACVSHSPCPRLDERDVQFVGLIARLVGGQLEQQQRAEQHERTHMTTELVRTLLAALGTRDGYTSDHSYGVVNLALAVGRRLDLDAAQLLEVEQVSLLHDIGKIGIPDHILQKPGALTPDEWVVMRTHPVIGADLVGRMDAVAHLAPAIRAEHERWDGTGYPDGLAREAIPTSSQIVFVCDALHAMTSNRPYRTAMSYRTAITQLHLNAGTQFAPAVVDATPPTVGSIHPAEFRPTKRPVQPDRRLPVRGRAEAGALKDPEARL
jgi:response regulator RpfG family c-di-GMP phosphodiesterase